MSTSTIGDWENQANCIGVDVDLFFPPKAGVLADGAKQICAACPVCAECLEYAVRNNITHGVWGGRSPAQRKRLRTQRRRARTA